MFSVLSDLGVGSPRNLNGIFIQNEIEELDDENVTPTIKVVVDVANGPCVTRYDLVSKQRQFSQQIHSSCLTSLIRQKKREEFPNQNEFGEIDLEEIVVSMSYNGEICIWKLDSILNQQEISYDKPIAKAIANQVKAMSLSISHSLTGILVVSEPEQTKLPLPSLFSLFTLHQSSGTSYSLKLRAEKKFPYCFGEFSSSNHIIGVGKASETLLSYHTNLSSSTIVAVHLSPKNLLEHEPSVSIIYDSPTISTVYATQVVSDSKKEKVGIGLSNRDLIIISSNTLQKLYNIPVHGSGYIKSFSFYTPPISLDGYVSSLYVLLSSSSGLLFIYHLPQKPTLIQDMSTEPTVISFCAFKVPNQNAFMLNVKERESKVNRKYPINDKKDTNIQSQFNFEELKDMTIWIFDECSCFLFQFPSSVSNLFYCSSSFSSSSTTPPPLLTPLEKEKENPHLITRQTLKRNHVNDSLDPLSVMSQYETTCCGIDFSGDGKVLVVGDFAGNVLIWSTEQSVRVSQSTNTSSSSSSHRLSNPLFRHHVPSSVRCISITDCTITEFDGSKNEVLVVSVGCLDGNLYLFSVSYSKNSKTLSSDDLKVSDVESLSFDEKISNGTKTSSNESSFDKESIRGGVTCLKWSRNSHQLALGTTKGYLILLQLSTLFDPQELKGKYYSCHGGKICIKVIACEQVHKPVYIENEEKRENFGSLQKFAEIWSLSWNWDDTLISTTSEDQSTRISSVSKTDSLITINRSLELHSLAVTSVDWQMTKLGNLLVTCSDDRKIGIWNGDTYELMFVLDTSEYVLDWHTLTYLALIPDSEFLLCSTQNGYVFLFSLVTKKAIFFSKIHASSVEGLRWSSSINCFGTCASDCTTLISQFRI